MWFIGGGGGYWLRDRDERQEPALPQRLEDRLLARKGIEKRERCQETAAQT